MKQIKFCVILTIWFVEVGQISEKSTGNRKQKHGKHWKKTWKHLATSWNNPGKTTKQNMERASKNMEQQ